MNDDPIPTQMSPTRVRCLALVLGLLLVTASWRSAAADPTYRYVDDRGTITFTDNEWSIPEKYRDQVTVLKNPQTTADGVEHPDSVAGSSTPPPVRSSDAGRWSGLSIPIPSRFQAGVGLTAVTLSLGLVIAMRASHSAAVRVVLKLGLVVILAAATYVLGFTTLNERISVATGDDANPQASGIDVARSAQRAITSLTTAVDRTSDATIGAARRAADAVNQANQEIDRATQASNPAP